ncbi:MAG: hypothetical protein LBU83_08795 [Bacteroidales bacterium]|jgi:hypothetical protein|nr:hypothetical protein [Bacteroidales bacterium]
MTDLGKVCISSVYDREDSFKDYRFIAAQIAKDLGYIPIRNPESHGITQLDFENILESDNPIFVLIVGKLDSLSVKRECEIARDKGLHIITLLKTENKKIPDETQKIMNEISKLIYDHDSCCFENCEELYSALYTRMLSYKSTKMNLKADINLDRHQIYEKGAEMVKKARKRIILCQETSCLILGPRNGNFVETKFYDAIIKWMAEMTPEMELIHLYSLSKTRNHIANTKEYNASEAENTLQDIKKQDKKICFRGYDEKTKDISLLITDNNLILPFHIDNNRYNIFIPHYITPSNKIDIIINDSQSIGDFISIENDIFDIYKS